jgi:hypothetical protein
MSNGGILSVLKNIFDTELTGVGTMAAAEIPALSTQHFSL